MASSAVRTYNSDKVVVTVGGVPLEGLADGTFVEIEPMTDSVTSQAGADGEVARAISTDRRHSVKITLQQTSQSNTVLSGLFELDQASQGGFMAPILVQDLSGVTNFTAAQAWIKRPPTIGFSKGVETRVWTFETGRPSVYLVGGNF
jgi:hypothetical protein